MISRVSKSKLEVGATGGGIELDSPKNPKPEAKASSESKTKDTKDSKDKKDKKDKKKDKKEKKGRLDDSSSEEDAKPVPAKPQTNLIEDLLGMDDVPVASSMPAATGFTAQPQSTNLLDDMFGGPSAPV